MTEWSFLDAYIAQKDPFKTFHKKTIGYTENMPLENEYLNTVLFY